MPCGMPVWLSERSLVNVSSDRLDMFQRRWREDAVAEIEDVTRASAGPGQHVVYRREDPIDRSKQQRRIEVALDGAIVSDSLPCLVERRTPVGADHVAAGLSHLRQDRPGSDAEVNRG